jgi:hypothetical protein
MLDLFSLINIKNIKKLMENVLEELICPVCLLYCEDAMHCVNCNKVFCQNCITSNNKFIPCPLCRKNVNFSESKLARRMIGTLPVTCPNACPDNLTREYLKSHLVKCPNRRLKCKLCKTEHSKEDFVNHLVNEHSYNLIEDYDEKSLAKPKPIENPFLVRVSIDKGVPNKQNFELPQNIVKYINFRINQTFEYKGKIVGTNKLEDLSDSSLTKGICCNKPGVLVIEFDKVYKFNLIHVGGYNGDKYSWAFATGTGSEIFTSVDGSQWIYVGYLQLSDNCNIAKVITNIVSTTEAKFIKFNAKGYLGIGFLAIPYI